MIKLTQSLGIFLFEYHKDILVPITFGHLELLTKEIEQEYLEWCKTEEGKKYLKGGSEYDEEYAKNIGVE
jgi:hypothetical protein